MKDLGCGCLDWQHQAGRVTHAEQQSRVGAPGSSPACADPSLVAHARARAHPHTDTSQAWTRAACSH